MEGYITTQIRIKTNPFTNKMYLKNIISMVISIKLGYII